MNCAGALAGIMLLGLGTLAAADGSPPAGRRFAPTPLSPRHAKHVVTPKYHEDVFGERELWFGFKAGPQISGYSPYVIPPVDVFPERTVQIQSKARYLGGLALKFIFDTPRIELDAFWNIRGAWNTTFGSIQAVAVPLVIKFPLHVRPKFDFELGGGGAVDWIQGGAEPHAKWGYGPLAAAGISTDLDSFILEVECRYFLGQKSMTPDYSGGQPRDLQLIAGALWRL